jgi:hypothetical protein
VLAKDSCKGRQLTSKLLFDAKMERMAFELNILAKIFCLIQRFFAAPKKSNSSIFSPTAFFASR